MDPSLAEAARALEKNMANDDITPLIKVEPHIKETLNILKSRYRTAVATNRGKSLPLVLQFHHLTDYFDVTVSSNQVTKSQTAPGVFRGYFAEILPGPRPGGIYRRC